MKHERVALVITRMDWGGSTDIVRALFEGLSARGVECILIFGLTRDPSLRTRAFLDLYKERIIMVPSLRRNINPLRDVVAFLTLLRLFRREHFSIVHTHTAKAGILGRLAAHAAGVKIIIHTPHGHNVYGYFGPLMSRCIVAVEQCVTRCTDMIIALTELERRDYGTFKVAPSHKTTLIRQGLVLDDFRDCRCDRDSLKKSFGIGADVPLVGFIGRLEHVKGPDLFIAAAARVAACVPQVQFLVVGEGSMRGRLEQQATKLGIREQVFFTGWRQDIPALMRLLDLLVIPSRNEAVGMVIIEAAASGIPCVATRVGGIPEVVKDEVGGVLVEPQDEAALAQAIVGVLGSDEKRKLMGAAAQEWANQHYRPAAMVEAHAALYKRLVAEKGDAA